jgi:hypothetical protein
MHRGATHHDDPDGSLSELTDSRTLFGLAFAGRAFVPELERAAAGETGLRPRRV